MKRLCVGYLFLISTFTILLLNSNSALASNLLQIKSNINSIEIDGQNYTVYQIHVIADDPENTAFAWEGKFEGNMHQVYQYQVLPNLILEARTPMLDSFVWEPEGKLIDSHFMFYQGRYFQMEYPSTYAYANQLTMQKGICESSSLLQGTFGLMPSRAELPDQPGTAQDLYFAQIVAPVGSVVSMIGKFADGNGVKTPVYITDLNILSYSTVSFAKVPEPSSCIFFTIILYRLFVRKRL